MCCVGGGKRGAAERDPGVRAGQRQQGHGAECRLSSVRCQPRSDSEAWVRKGRRRAWWVRGADQDICRSNEKEWPCQGLWYRASAHAADSFLPLSLCVCVWRAARMRVPAAEQGTPGMGRRRAAAEAAGEHNGLSVRRGSSPVGGQAGGGRGRGRGRERATVARSVGRSTGVVLW